MATIQWREYRVTINPYPYFDQPHAEGINQLGKRTIWLDDATIALIQREARCEQPNL